MLSHEMNIQEYKDKINTLRSYTQNANVLLVEDDKYIHENIKKLLNKLFHTVDSSFNGKEALTLYKKNRANKIKYDIIFTDIEMPYMNGIELSKAIRDINPTKNIVVFSAYQDAKYLIDLINNGIRRFIPKPISLPLLLHELLILYENIHEQIATKNLIELHYKLFYNKQEKSLYIDNKLIIFTKYEQLIINLLIEKLNLVVSNDEIVNYLYLHMVDIKIDNIRKIMYSLRQKLPKELVESVHGIGYRLVKVIKDN